MIERFFFDVDGPAGKRRVHARRFGNGPPLIMVHQSPRSSVEYEPLMRMWGAHFSCIAPDTPGFGQSDPLPGEPEIEHFATALLGTMDALRLDRPATYGFHSGAIVVMAALKQAPEQFGRVALGGYAVWTEAEMALFAESYLPPFLPSPYGEHLTWLWNRMLEQSWFFPWFDARPEARLSVAHADIARVQQAVMEMLDAGDGYRAGYGAVLRAERSIPEGSPVIPPVLITAYDGDPLQAHLSRLGALPAGWEAYPVTDVDAHRAVSLDWLLRDASGNAPPPTTATDEGFVRIAAGGFDGRIHWLGGGETLRLHAPGGEARRGEGIAIDLPGHGLSDAMPDGATLAHWRAVVAACERHFGTRVTVAEGATAVLTGNAPLLDPGMADRLLPDLTPDRFGGHLTRAWGVARATRLFDPWYEADAAHARVFDPADLAPEAIARDARALLRARSGRTLLNALSSRGG